MSGKRKGKKIGYPKYKRKDNRQSARFRKGGFSIKRGKVYLAKIGLLSTRWSRELPSEPSSVTVIKDRANRYFLSFVVEIDPVPEPASRESIGVDLGIKIFAALSTGEAIYSPDYSRLERKIRRTKRTLSRREKDSRRREQTRLRLAKLCSKVAAIRKDFLHKLSTYLVKENGIICLEDLNVAGMVKNRRLARAISSAGWGMFRTMCEAKSNKYNRDFRIINRWEPTSQVCSSCGYKWGKLNLSVREIVCMGCGEKHCRDANAAKNIVNVAVGHIDDAKRTGNERKTSVLADRVELSTRKVEWVQLSLPI